MLPRMVEMVVNIPAAAIVPNPAVVLGMNVRRLGMSLGVVEFAVFILRRRFVASRSTHWGRAARWRGTVRRNVSATYTMFSWTMRRGPTSVLRIERQGKK